MYLKEIDQLNHCNDQHQLMPKGLIKYNLFIAPKFPFEERVSLFVNCVLLEDYEYYMQKLLKSRKCKHVVIDHPISAFNFSNYMSNDFVRQLLRIDGVLAAQYIIHGLRKCDFLSDAYKDHIVLHAYNASVDNVKRVHTHPLLKNEITSPQANLFLNENQVYYSKHCETQGLRSFIASECVTHVSNVFPEILKYNVF